jgi:hypothetical protein
MFYHRMQYLCKLSSKAQCIIGIKVKVLFYLQVLVCKNICKSNNKMCYLQKYLQIQFLSSAVDCCSFVLT